MRQATLITGSVLLASWAAYFLTLLPIDFNDGASGWLLATISVIGFVGGAMAIARRPYWSVLMWISAVGVVVVYVLLWEGYAMTLSESPPHGSLLTSLGEVAVGKLRLVKYIAENEGWLSSARQAVWEITPLVQIAILILHYTLTWRGGRAVKS